MVQFEDALVQIGGFGRYQKTLFYVSMGIITLVSVWGNLPIVFLTATPDHWCKSPKLDDFNLTGEEIRNISIPTEGPVEHLKYSQCQQYDLDFTNRTKDELLGMMSGPKVNTSRVECTSGWVYDDSIYKSTIVTEWDVVCGMEVWVATAKSVYLAGFLVGVISFGILADLYGRKKIYIGTTILTLVAYVLIPLSPNLGCFLAFRFFLGFAMIGNFTVAYVLVMEEVPTEWRGFINMVGSYMWVGASFLTTGVAYLIRNWRHLALAMAIPSVLQFVNIFIMLESPRWLYTQDRKEEGDAIMKRIAKINKTEFPDKMDVQIKQTQKGRIIDLIKYPRLRTRMFILCVQWFAVTMVYYGLAYSSADFDLGGNPYLNFFLGVAIELPSAIVCHFSQRFVGRKVVLIVLDIIGGASLIGISFVPKYYAHAYIISTILSLLGRLCATGVFIMIYLYTAEVLPTVVRSVGMGVASATARIGGIAAPYLMAAKTVSIFIPYMTMGGMSIVAAILLFPLPETKGKKLPETLQEGEQFGRSNAEKDMKVATVDPEYMTSTHM